MPSQLQALTPELYAELGRRERARSDSLFDRRWSGRIPQIDPLFAAMRAYSQAQVAWMMILGVFAYAGAIVIALGGGGVWWTLVGALLICVWLVVACRTTARLLRIGRYFRARGVTARSRGR